MKGVGCVGWAGAHRPVRWLPVCVGIGVTAFPAIVAAQEQQPEQLRFAVHLLSEAGGVVDRGDLVAQALDAGANASGPAFRADVVDGMVEIYLERGRSYRITARAPGHREHTREITPARSTTVRIVLLVDPYQLPPIVAATRGAAVAEVARSVDHVRFARRSLTYATVDEWLADVPGAWVRGRGPGGRQVLSVRGSRPEDVLVLLDGVPLNDPITGRADLSMIPTSTLESGTLVRGAASQRYGSGASAGALLLTSRVGSGTGLGGGFRMRSFGGMGFDVQMDAASGSRRLGVSFSAERAQNDFAFRNPLVAGGPAEVRTNADAMSAHGAVQAASGPVHTSMRFHRSERGVPGRAGTSLFEGARADDRSWIGAAGIDGAYGKLSASYAWRGSAYQSSSAQPTSEQNVREFRLSGDAAVPSLPLTMGGRVTRETVGGDLVDGSPTRALWGIRASGAFAAGSIRIEPALSVDASGGRLVTSPEVSATWLAGARTRIWGRIGQGFRLPTFGDLYFASQYRLRPNPDLDPERVSLDAEAGIAVSASGGSVRFNASTTGWVRRTEDPIVWLASSVAVWSPQNLDELRAHGIEIEVGLETPEANRSGWRIQVAGTFQQSRVGFGANRNALPYEPTSIGRFSMEGWKGSVGGRVDLRYTGSRPTSLAATRNLGGFLTTDLSARYQLDAGSLGLGLFLRVENVVDQRYQLIELFPEPGRSFSVRLEARRASR